MSGFLNTLLGSKKKFNIERVFPVGHPLRDLPVEWLKLIYENELRDIEVVTEFESFVMCLHLQNDFEVDDQEKEEWLGKADECRRKFRKYCKRNEIAVHMSNGRKARKDSLLELSGNDFKGNNLLSKSLGGEIAVRKKARGKRTRVLKKFSQEELYDLFPESQLKTSIKKSFKLKKSNRGNIFVGKEKIQREKVAIKTYDIDHYDVSIQSLANELTFLQECACDYVISVKRASRSGNIISIATEFCEGGTLKHMTHMKLRDDHIQYFSYNILKGLEFIHSNDIILRNLNSSNILLTSEGNIKLCSFQRAIRVNGDQSTMEKCKYSHWQPPEILLNKPYGKKIDIWSFGCVVSEMMNGRVSYGEFKLFKAAFYTLSKGPADPEIHEDGIQWSKQILGFLKRCHKIEPSERYDATRLLAHSFLLNVDFECTELRQVIATNAATLIDDTFE